MLLALKRGRSPSMVDYMSCSQVKQEMDYEGARIHRAQLSRKLPAILCVRVEIPTSFKDSRYLCVSLSTKYSDIRRKWRTTALQPWGFRSLQWLFDLHLDSVRVTWHEDECHAFFDNHVYWFTEHMHILMGEWNVLNTGRVVIHRPDMLQRRPWRDDSYDGAW
jgi:hypothetical protein